MKKMDWKATWNRNFQSYVFDNFRNKFVSAHCTVMFNVSTVKDKNHKRSIFPILPVNVLLSYFMMHFYAPPSPPREHCSPLWNFNIANNSINLEQWVLELWNFKWVFHVIRPFRGYHYFLDWPWPWSLTHFFENFNLANNFGVVSARALPLIRTFEHWVLQLSLQLISHEHS